MPAPGANAQQAQPNAAPVAGNVPFQVGSFHYSEQISVDALVLSAASVATEFVHNITPGGFLRGVDLILATTAVGSGITPVGDGAFGGITSMSLENIDGSPILYPMNGFAYAQWQRFSAPWLDDPNLAIATGGNYVSSATSIGASLHMWPEIFGTAGVLANTDARAQYRFRYTLGAGPSFGSAFTTYPTLSGTLNLQTWAQPDREDLNGNAIQPVPPGLGLARIVRHQIFPLNPGGAQNILQLNNTGNEIRNIILIVRDATAAQVRQDWIAGPMRLRLDDRSMGVYQPASLFQLATRFYPNLGNGTVTRPTGVYVIPRFRASAPNNDPEVFGQYWLPTTNATFLTLEFPSNAAATAGSTVEVITDEVVPVGTVDANLEGI